MFANTGYIQWVCSTAFMWNVLFPQAWCLSPHCELHCRQGQALPFTGFKCLIINQVQVLLTVWGSKGDRRLNLSCPSIFTLVEGTCICCKPGQCNHWQVKSLGETITPELMDWRQGIKWGDFLHFFRMPGLVSDTKHFSEAEKSFS